jgi:hypothetical protein
MSLNNLKEFLDNIGPLVHDVEFYDVDGNQLFEEDLKKLDFDNLTVIDTETEEDYGDGEQESEKWTVIKITVNVKKAAK